MCSCVCVCDPVSVWLFVVGLSVCLSVCLLSTSLLACLLAAGCLPVRLSVRL